jgi:hypothetical protein
VVSQWETDLGYAITQIDPESSGIALLKHELAQVRKGAWLAIGKVANVNIINELVKQRRESEPEQAHFRHATYRAIDNALITIEMQGNAQDLLERFLQNSYDEGRDRSAPTKHHVFQ